MKNILISVIIPVYNTEKFLNRCLDSVLSQSLKEIEIIIVNDNSPDNSKEIIDEYARKDKRIVVINKKENKGLSSARKSGLKIARGEYILNIDSDDWIEQNYFNDTYTMAKKENADIVISDYYIDYDNGEILYKIDQKRDFLLEKEEVVNNIFLKDSPVVWNKLIKRSLYEKNDIFPIDSISLGEDLAVVPRLIYFSKKIVKLNKAYVHYIQNPNSITKKKNIEKIFSLYSAIKVLEDFFKDKKEFQIDRLKITHLGLTLMKENYDIKNIAYLNILEDYFDTVKNIKIEKSYSALEKIMGKIYSIKIFRNKYIFVFNWYLYNLYIYQKSKVKNLKNYRIKSMKFFL